MKNRLHLILLLLLPYCAVAQLIPLSNPSFEGVPRHSQVPRGWYDCGFPGESPPDIQPDLNGTFEVNKLAQHGNTYLGMVVRDNNTWESVSQKLKTPLQRDSCYTFFIYVARSLTYISQSRVTELQANYDTPTVIRIWGGFDYCDKGELLGESDPIINPDWKEIQLALEPSRNFTHIIIEAFYKSPVLFPYNGNVLVDNAQLEKGCGALVEEVNKDTIISDEPKLTIADVQPKVKQKPAALPTVLPLTDEELKKAIAEYGKYVYFDKNGTQLETADFTLNGQSFKNLNPYLTFIAKALLQFPDYRLLISVDGVDNAKYQRTINLQDRLLELGLDEEHFTVYPYNELDLRKEWLWIATDNDLLMQIVPIKK